MSPAQGSHIQHIFSSPRRKEKWLGLLWQVHQFACLGLSNCGSVVKKRSLILLNGSWMQGSLNEHVVFHWEEVFLAEVFSFFGGGNCWRDVLSGWLFFGKKFSCGGKKSLSGKRLLIQKWRQRITLFQEACFCGTGNTLSRPFWSEGRLLLQEWFHARKMACLFQGWDIFCGENIFYDSPSFLLGSLFFWPTCPDGCYYAIVGSGLWGIRNMTTIILIWRLCLHGSIALRHVFLGVLCFRQSNCFTLRVLLEAEW